MDLSPLYTMFVEYLLLAESTPDKAYAKKLYASIGRLSVDIEQSDLPKLYDQARNYAITFDRKVVFEDLNDFDENDIDEIQSIERFFLEKLNVFVRFEKKLSDGKLVLSLRDLDTGLFLQNIRSNPEEYKRIKLIRDLKSTNE